MCNLDRIIDKCKQGDRQAAEKIYQIFSAKMFALCLRFSKDRADAEDTLQDGFIKIFTSIGQYTGKGSFEGWMKRIMINTAMLADFVNQLPERYKMVFNLYVIEEMSHKDIAALLGINEGTSKSNLARAREILKRKVKEYLDHEQ